MLGHRLTRLFTEQIWPGMDFFILAIWIESNVFLVEEY